MEFDGVTSEWARESHSQASKNASFGMLERLAVM
jgi:hypothetical protein